ncbi:hypothetical protein GGS24DRAFT_492866 [Hypoxylon argillaceum]|nr:hypothetical protein GGS24DRAFT_492866 [Hypoxylon argillaceum]
MATTFHAFGNLPTELRLQIWGLAIRPRIVHVRATRFEYKTSTPPPGLMQACRESRRCAPYEKAFVMSRFRYIWVNFQLDMISIADDEMNRLAPHCAAIERLRFTVPTGDAGDRFYESFFHWGDEVLREFLALRELHIVVEDVYLFWGSAWEGVRYGKCPRENVRFLDPHTGLLLTGPQLEMAYEWSWQKGGKVLDIDDIDEEVQFMVQGVTGLNFSELAKID